MAEKINAKNAGIASAAVFGIISILCFLIAAAAPDFAIKVFGLIFHGIDMAKIAATINPALGILGVIESIIIGFVIGWLFAVIYNKLQ